MLSRWNHWHCWLVVITAAASSQPALAVDVSADDRAALVRENTAFGFALYHQLRREDSGNVCFSPYSISTALAMVYAGARGDTAEQMATAMNISLPADRLHAAYKSLGAGLDCGREKRACQLTLVNRLWARSDVNLEPHFVRTVRDSYGTEPATLDFAHDPEASRQKINAWVADMTRHKINELLSPAEVSPDTSLVLTNAVYFKAAWAKPFDKSATRVAPFHAAVGPDVDASLMHQTDEFRYAETDDVQLLELPYEGGQFSLIIALPRKSEALPKIESRLSGDLFRQWLARLDKRRVEILLPKLSLAARLDLKANLESIGMRRPFAADADFSGMTSAKGAALSAVVHEAFIDVNEEGTEAAAATAVAVKDSEPTVFRADHPFLFFVTQNDIGCILFMGRLNRPQMIAQ